MISILSPADVQGTLRATLLKRRKQAKHSREQAALITGVPAPTIRRFESAGEISLRQFLMLCEAYGDLELLPQLLPEPVAKTMDELIAHAEAQGK